MSISGGCPQAIRCSCPSQVSGKKTRISSWTWQPKHAREKNPTPQAVGTNQPYKLNHQVRSLLRAMLLESFRPPQLQLVPQHPRSPKIRRRPPSWPSQKQGENQKLRLELPSPAQGVNWKEICSVVCCNPTYMVLSAHPSVPRAQVRRKILCM